jgi:hypothetical protein
MAVTKAVLMVDSMAVLKGATTVVTRAVEMASNWADLMADTKAFR